MPDKRVILDTCAFLWLAQGQDTLSSKALSVIEGASIVLVSAISAWEIGLKAARGQLELPMEPEKWFHSVLKNHDLTIAPLDVDILMAANQLPWHHRDPADRFIIATAIKGNATVVTGDKHFKKYGVRVVV